MSLIYGKLFGLDWQNYMPFLAVSFVIWVHISTIINESCNVFIDNKQMIFNLPNIYFTIVMRMLWRNLIILLHNILMIVAVFMFLNTEVFFFNIIISSFAAILITVNGIWISLIIGGLSARYRDIPPLVQSIVQVVFFITPIMWSADLIAHKSQEYWWITELNPFFHYIEIFRSPLIKGTINFNNWIVAFSITFLGTISSLIFLYKFKSKITLWL